MRKIILISTSIIFSFLACSEYLPISDRGTSLPITIVPYFPLNEITRATSNSFSDGDQVGIFVVDYDEGNPGVMSLQGNRASNVVFTYNEATGKWKAPMTLFWSGDGIPADIVSYYPFLESLQSITNQPVTVCHDQDRVATAIKKSGYEESDWLWAKTENVYPTTETVALKHKHIMAGIAIRLEHGSGFSDEEWMKMEKIILVTNLMLNGNVNFTNGIVTPADNKKTHPIVPVAYGDEWRAIAIPQTLAEDIPILNITIDGHSYQLIKDEPMTLISGRMHNFTIKVDRYIGNEDYDFQLVNEDILPWEDDARIYDGITRAYVTVKTEKAGTLKQTIENNGGNYRSISSLKVIGDINRSDLEFMGQEMELLTHLNLQKTNIVGNGNEAGTLTGFKNNKMLYNIFFPDEGMTAIGDSAFFCTNIGRRQSLVIPEGVESIGHGAFYDCGYEGTLSLPSTLRFIGVGAFSYNNFTGNLLLPENLSFGIIDDIAQTPAFYGSDFNGSLHLSAGMVNLTHLGFPSIKGDIIIPQGVTQLNSPPNNYLYQWGTFSDGGYDGVVRIPEGVTTIGSETFARTNIRGEVKLPSTLRRMAYSAFEATNISNVIFNDDLTSMEKDCFKQCFSLSGTITWPKRNVRIPEGTFEDCRMLSGIILHKDVKVIGEEAFLRCNNLLSIICESENPPLVCKNAFLGVPKMDAIVKVPRSAVTKYKEADGWKDFKKIVASSNFVCEPSTACALNSQHEEPIIIYSDGAWTVKHLPSWCSLSQTEGNGKTLLTLTFQPLQQGQSMRTDSIAFCKTDDDNTITYCKIAQYDYTYKENECILLQEHSKGKGIDIVFVGDGWNAKSIADDSYIDLIRYQTECFFSIEPYRSMRNYFNVYVTFPLSQENGVNTMYTYVNNKFGTLNGEISFSNKEITSSQLITEIDKVVDYVLMYTPIERSTLSHSQIILVPNSTDYGGNTIFGKDDSSLSICPPSENDYPNDTRGIIQHEAGGHGFGKLGDENISTNKFAPDRIIRDIEFKHSDGWYQNLSTTRKIHDVPWAEFIFDPDYSDRVDVYEGGYGYTRGIYRPESNSCMNYGIPYYNTPSRLAIWKRIKEYAGERWTMNEFRTQDTFEWGPTNITRSFSTYSMRDILPGQGYAESNRHVMPSVVDSKKMGDKVRAIRARLKNERNRMKETKCK